MKTYDYIIVGGGIFGIYASIYLAKNDLKVCLVEKERELMQKASIVNQARLHSGYHYPRSIATARIADNHKERFIQDHKQFINYSFKQYYAIDKYSSFTDAAQFERFCDFLGIKAEHVKEHDLIDFGRIEELYLTDEYSFDPLLIAEYYRELLKHEENVTVKMNSLVVASDKGDNCWIVRIAEREDNTESWIKAYNAINATYSGTNTVNTIFNVEKIKLMHEISELVFISSPPIKDFGLTVMDGNFCSIMPYGLSGLLCLSSVVYSHQKVSYSDEPVFDCQQMNKECRPDRISVCNSCEARPRSNQYKMIRQMSKYLSKYVTLDYMFSMFTIKSKLQASHIDDGRPTVISKLAAAPDYYCLFAGKINSIYEIEHILQQV